MTKSRDLAGLPAGSGDINIDGGTLFVDASTNRVGIGTTSPERPFHVEGAGLVKNTSGEALFKLQASSTSNSILEFADTDDGNVGRVQYEHDNNAMLFFTSDAERMRIDSSGDTTIKNTGGTDGGIRIGAWTGGSTYSGVYSEGHAGNEYVLITNGSSTFLSSGSGGTTYIRAGDNDQNSELGMTATGAKFVGNVYPETNNSYDLGTSSLRWRNIYTNDLNLSNGIGDYTVVEGEEDLFLYNNKSGKVFKFALIEVDPSEAPAKTEKS